MAHMLHVMQWTQKRVLLHVTSGDVTAFQVLTVQEFLSAQRLWVGRAGPRCTRAFRPCCVCLGFSWTPDGLSWHWYSNHQSFPISRNSSLCQLKPFWQWFSVDSKITTEWPPGCLSVWVCSEVWHHLPLWPSWKYPCHWLESRSHGACHGQCLHFCGTSVVLSQYLCFCHSIISLCTVSIITEGGRIWARR